MNILSRIVTLFFFVVMTGCALNPAQSEQSLLQEAVKALKSEEWERYSRLTITSADFILKKNNVSVFKEKQTYAGGVLKPEEQKSQKEQFLRAARGGPGLMDFKHSHLISVAQIDQGNLELLTEGEIPFKVFALRLKVDARSGDSKTLPPYFVVVPWEGGYRILRLDFVERAPE